MKGLGVVLFLLGICVFAWHDCVNERREEQIRMDAYEDAFGWDFSGAEQGDLKRDNYGYDGSDRPDWIDDQDHLEMEAAAESWK